MHKSMKEQITRWGSLAAAVGLACAMSIGSVRADDSKKFKETGKEYIVTSLAPSSLLEPLFVEARERHGADTQIWSGVGHQFSENNVGGKGNSVMFEQVHMVAPTSEIPTGVIVYGMKYETVANGDRFVMAGYFIPQTDGSYVANLWFVPSQGTGRFAGVTGKIGTVIGIPGGYILEGTINIVSTTKKSD